MIDEKALAEGYQVVAPSMSYGIYRAAVRAYETVKADQPDGKPHNQHELRISLCEALYPGGIKHSQQAEWWSMIEQVRSLKRESGNDPKLSACYVALRRLVELKDHKDSAGKTLWYEQEQPYAWQQARAAINDVEVEP